MAKELRVFRTEKKYVLNTIQARKRVFLLGL